MATPDARIRGVYHWTPSREGLLGLLASNDLLLRTLADLPWRRLTTNLDLLSESVLASFTLTVLANVSDELRLIATLAQWLLLFYLFVLLTPRLFLRSARPNTSDRTFKLVTAISGLGYAFILVPFLSTSTPVEGTELALRFTTITLTTIGLYVAYFSARVDWNQLRPDERVALLDRFIPVPDRAQQELITGFKAGGRRTHIEIHAWKAALVIVCVIPVFLLGAFAAFSILLFPVLELAVLTGLAIQRWNRSTAGRIGRIGLDIEARFYASLRNAARGLKGMTLMALILCGLVFPVGLFAASLAFFLHSLPSMNQLLAEPTRISVSPASRLVVWNQVGVLTTLILSSGYQLWFWLRMLDRLPAYLTDWETHGNPALDPRHSLTPPPAALNDQFEPHFLLTPPPFYHRILHQVIEALTASHDPPTRPVGYLLPPMLVLTITANYMITGWPGTVGYSLLWPASIAILLLCVLFTWRNQPQPLPTDSIAFPAALMIQLASYSGLGEAFTGPGIALKMGTSLLQPMTVFILLLVPWLFYFGDVHRYARRQPGLFHYASSGYLLVFGAAGLLLVTPPTSPVSTLLTVISLVCLGSAVLVGIAVHFDQY